MLPRHPSHRPMPTNPYHYPMNPGFNRQMPRNTAPFHAPFGRQAPMQRKQGGGLLAKLLQRGGKGSGASRGALPFNGMGVQNAARGGGSILQTLTNPASINGFLTNTQKVLNTAQQIGPLVQQVQQYGPIVKNIPAMWRLYKGLKDAPDAKETKNEGSSKKEPTSAPVVSASQRKDKTTGTETEEGKSTKRESIGHSVPKMYI
jgi:hypothetical protein